VQLRAEFVAAAQSLESCPRWSRLEVALAGRSNVGKSALLNALTGVKNLARVSATPGRTRSLNFFACGASLVLVDLPGYGYAAVSHKEAARIASMLRAYLRGRPNLAALVLLIDSRRGPGAEELELAAAVTERNVDLIVVATKCDKLRMAERAAIPKLFAPMGRPPILCSTRAMKGSDAAGIDKLRRLLTSYAARGGSHRGSDTAGLYRAS
jgi:GTP-binding protein